MGNTNRISLTGVKKPSREDARKVFLTCAMLMVISIAVGALSGEMRPSMAAIYFVLGFVMQRAGFCSASMISGVVLSGDRRGMLAIFVAVLTAMLGFGLMHSLGLITVYPGRISVFPAALGGLLFGVGMVFAGGCVSGSLFKATEGRWPSILAVFGILIGMAAATSSWGREAMVYVAEFGSFWSPDPNLTSPGGGRFAHLSMGVALMGLALVSVSNRTGILTFRPRVAFPVDRRWPLCGVAVLVGSLGWIAFAIGPAVGRYYPLGASHIPNAVVQLLVMGDVSQAGLLACTFLLGSAVSAWMRGEIRWRSAPKDVLALAFFGGLLVGLGAILGGGCFVGQILSGWALLSTDALIFGVVMILTNWVTTFFYLRGWR